MKINIIKNWTLKKIIWTKYFIVYEEFSFWMEAYWKKYNINIPKWFLTDCGSIPPIFFYFNKSKYISYIMHDFLYNYIWEIILDGQSKKYNQLESDEILIAWLKTEGMNKIWRIQVLIWLSLFGRFNFKKKNKQISLMKKLINKNNQNEHSI